MRRLKIHTFLALLIAATTSSLCLGQMVGEADSQFGQAGQLSLAKVDQTQIPLLLNPLSDGSFFTTQTLSDESIAFVEVRKFLKEGQEDPTFATNGVRKIMLEGAVQQVVVAKDSSIYLCGFVQRGRERDIWVMRLKPDGKTDPSFGTQGVLTHSVAEQDVAECLQILPNKDLLIAGTSYSPDQLDRDIFVMKVNQDGRVDFSYGRRGIAILDFSKDDRVKSIQVRHDGRLVIAGNSRPDRLSRFMVARLLPNGMKDPAFGHDGSVILPIGIDQSYLEAMILLEDERIMLGGNAKMREQDQGFDLVVTRLLPEGQWDPSYGQHGTYICDLHGADYFGGMRLQQDQMLVVAGMSGMEATVLRLREDGSLDPTFGRAGKSVHASNSRMKSATISLTAEENILIGLATNDGVHIKSLFGNPRLYGLDEILGFNWQVGEQANLAYSGLSFADGIQVDAWVGGPIIPTEARIAVSGIKSTEPVPRHVRFYAHLSLDSQRRYTFVWDSEGHAHWYWNGSFRNSWDALKE